jgi:hypothetical protein
MPENSVEWEPALSANSPVILGQAFATSIAINDQG